MSQNVVQLEYLYNYPDVISRMGGNRSFDDRKFEVVKRYLSLMKQCHALIATNQHLEKIGKLVNKNTYLISNGVDLDVWKPRKGRIWRKQYPIVGFIGNISTPEKAVYKGFPQLKDACMSLSLHLFPALYKSRQIPHRQMIQEFYYKIDVFVLPTAGEGTNNSVVEALATGVPCILSKTSGYHGETMTHGENVLFCDRNKESIKEQLLCLMHTPGLYEKLSENGRLFAKQHHDIRAIAEKYRRVFDAYFEEKNKPAPLGGEDVDSGSSGIFPNGKETA